MTRWGRQVEKALARPLVDGNFSAAQKMLMQSGHSKLWAEVTHSRLLQVLIRCTKGQRLQLFWLWGQYPTCTSEFFLNGLGSHKIAFDFEMTVTNNNSISFKGCVLQVFFFVSAVVSEVALITVMSYDRYAAICHPLRYEAVMNRGVCGKMAAASWLSGGLSGLMHTAATFSEPFSGPNIIHQFFSTSYVRIFSAELRMPPAEGRSKAFSTCLPHLIVVTFFVSTGVSEYLIPSSNCPSCRDLLLSVFYSMVPPDLNPVIYSLRNQEVNHLS
ncbi:putative olfactory receptor 14L1 [Tachyglossus aculeatus]|uniref:putative olfactory receptor 14L1 n=1 Tax=Tachyglossus aculeatus TaxID=9261 RepID=UPI0018F3FE82|nr:putative olfactory receptor 14L1 [Tachyglossus aculeatus]